MSRKTVIFWLFGSCCWHVYFELMGMFEGLIDWSFWDWRRNQQSGLNPECSVNSLFKRHVSSMMPGALFVYTVLLVESFHSFGDKVVSEADRDINCQKLGCWVIDGYSLSAFRIVSPHMLKFHRDECRFGIDLVSVALFLAVNWSNNPLLTASSEDMRREWCAGCWFSPSFCWCLV